MMPAARGSSVLHDAGELVESSAERTKDALDAVRQASGGEADCTPRNEAAEGRFRLKAAVVTGIVTLVLTAVVFVVARQIRRRAERRPSEERHPSRDGGLGERPARAVSRG